MNAELVERIAAAVLYEGHILYPYRPTSRKNARERFTFGRVYPEAYSHAQQGAEPCATQTECLVETGRPEEAGGSLRRPAKGERGRNMLPEVARSDRAAATHRCGSLAVVVRFLQPVAREIGELTGQILNWKGIEPPFRIVQELRVGEELFQTWHEAIERRIEAPPLKLDPGKRNWQHVRFRFPAMRTLEPICDGTRHVGVVMRRQSATEGMLEIVALPLGSRLFHVSVRVLNQTPLTGAEAREPGTVLLRTFASTHTILNVPGGEFISLMEPPDEHRGRVSQCRNLGAWPVLVGDPRKGERDTMLSSPIILYDYPQIAPESAGSLFDGTEIDEILTLRIQTLTDREKFEMRNVEQQARDLLERTEALTSEALFKMHGTMRETKPATGSVPPISCDSATPPDVAGEPRMKPANARGAGAAETGPGPFSVNAQPSREAAVDFDDFFGAGTQLRGVAAGGVYLKRGDRVRVRPKARADVMDLALSGQTAIVEAIEEDLEHHVHLAVVIENDPGIDLGMLRQPGHRFFYGVDEVEPIVEGRR